MVFWLSSETFAIGKTMLGEGHAHDVTHLNRSISWNNEVFTIDGDTKCRDTLLKEWRTEYCNYVAPF